MKKLLSLLGVVTITGTSVTTLTSTNFISTKLESNKINLKAKKISAEPWSKNVNLLENWYIFLGHNVLIAYISHNTWQDIAFVHDISNRTEFSNALFGILNDFEKRDHSGGTGVYDYMQASDINIIKDVIIDHYDEINNVFLNKHDNSRGIGIKTNRAKYWYNNPNDLNWGVHPNSEKIFP